MNHSSDPDKGATTKCSKKSCSEEFHEIQRKTPVKEKSLSKVAGQSWNFTKNVSDFSEIILVYGLSSPGYRSLTEGI